MYDIIPDIHADIDRLNRILTNLGYQPSNDGWHHPENRTAVFLGDFIDGGSDNAGVIRTVRQMIDNANALAIMGNHELNALLYHHPADTAQGWLRPHTPKNQNQHRTFLSEFPIGAPDTVDALQWFMSLPLFLDLGEFRVVHAYWNDDLIAEISKRRADARLKASDLPEIAAEKTPFARAVIDTLKGPEIELPEGFSFRDGSGDRRTSVRFKWWRSDARTYRDAAASVCDLDVIPDIALPTKVRLTAYPPDAKPVFFGHYKLLSLQDRSGGNNLRCLDCPRLDPSQSFQ